MMPSDLIISLSKACVCMCVFCLIYMANPLPDLVSNRMACTEPSGDPHHHRPKGEHKSQSVCVCVLL